MSLPRYSEYKDSGVEWLGAVPGHWEISRLKFHAPISTEKLDSKPEGLPYIGLENISSWTGQFVESEEREEVASTVAVFRPGDVIFGKLRPYLAKAALPTFEGVGSTELAVLRPGPQTDKKFLLYLVLSDGVIRELDALTYGAKMPRVSPDQIANLCFVCPPLAEQYAIAAFLDRETARIDALIAKQERLIALLHEKRKAVISHAVTRGLDPEAPLKDSGVEGLGAIPQHWVMKKLKYLSPEQTVGVVVNPSSYVVDDGEVPFLLGSDISENSISLEKVRRISRESNEILVKSKLRAGDLVTVRVGDPGVTAVIPPALDGCNCASVMVVRQADQFLSEWLCYVMNSSVGRAQVEIVQYGAAQKQFNISHAIYFVYPVPPIEEQVLIVQCLDAETAKIDTLIAKTESVISLLREHRASLISAAVTGKIDVRGL